MRRICYILAICFLGTAGRARTASAEEDLTLWKRIDSRYCTIWLHPEVETKKVSRRISTWRVHDRVKSSEDTDESELAAKCDTIFRRAQEILDMYPPGVRTTLKVVKKRSEIEQLYERRYGYDPESIAFYEFEANTIYVAEKDISESVLAHEMGHCIIDHYFRVRPPRKIEELLAMHVDEHLRD